MFFKVLLFAILSLLVASGSVFSQDTVKLTKREQRKIERKKKKEKILKVEFEQRMKYAKMLKEKHFVFEGDQLFSPRGESYSVSSNINFLAVAGKTVVFQFGFDGVVGWNGVGGYTAEGHIDKYKFNPGKNRNSALSVESQVIPNIGGGRAYFQITVMDNGNAQLNMTMAHGGTIRMSGRIVTSNKASVFKGQTAF